MPGPLHALTFVHSAIRKELRVFEDAATRLDPKDSTAVSALDQRWKAFAEFIHDHHGGEDTILFPAIEQKAPQVVKAYDLDHRADEVHMSAVEECLRDLRSPQKAGEAVKTLRHEAVAFCSAMSHHLDKEEKHLLPIADKTMTPPEQGALVGRMSAYTPQERMPAGLAWMFTRMATDDRAGMLRVMKAGAPPPVFQFIACVVSKAIGPENWAEVVRRFPEVAAK